MHSDDYKKGWFDGYQAGKITPFSFRPVTPLPVHVSFKTTCGKCNMNWEGAMGYVCPDLECPMQPKAR